MIQSGPLKTLRHPPAAKERHMDLLFEVRGCLQRKIRVTQSHWDLISQRKHPEVAELEHFVQFALVDADCIRVSQEAPDVFLYYKWYRRHYLCVVCKHLNGHG